MDILKEKKIERKLKSVLSFHHFAKEVQVEYSLVVRNESKFGFLKSFENFEEACKFASKCEGDFIIWIDGDVSIEYGYDRKKGVYCSEATNYLNS